MRRAVLVIIIVVASIGFVIAGYYLLSGSGTPGGAAADVGGGNAGGTEGMGSTILGTGALSPIDAKSIPPGNTIDIGTPGGVVTVNNFYKNAAGFDGEALVIRKDAGYEITYNAGSGAFGIYVMSAPLTTEEQAAEQELLSILNVSQGDACKLDASWSAAASVDRVAVGRSYPLSFCIQGAQP